MLMSAWACSVGSDGSVPTPPPPSNAIASLSVLPSSLSLYRSAKGQLGVEARNASGNVIAAPTVTWSSGDATVAAVSVSGEVTGVSAGLTTVSARAGTLVATAAITVRAPPTYVLTVATDSGVQGSPSPGSQSVDSGLTLTYAYQAKPGYQAPRVFRDTSRLTASGAFTITGPTLLVASADPVADLSTAASALVAPTRALLSAADPVVALTQLEASYGAFVGGGDTAKVLELEIVRREAFRDAAPEELNAFYRRLGARPAGVASIVRPTAPNAARAAGHVPHVFYVNGILNDPGDAAATTAHIRSIAAAYGYTTSMRYNPSWRQETGTTWWSCMWEKIQGFSWTNAFAVLLPCGAILRDLAEAQAQIEFILAGTSGTHPFVTELKEAIATRVDAGQSVIIAAHSQGNLMTQEALAQLLIATPPAFASAVARCVGVVSFAAPLSEGFPAGFRVDGMAAAGVRSQDVLLSYPGKNRFPTLTSSITRRADLFPTAFPVNFFTGIWIHGAGSYLGASATRSWIGQHIQDVGQQLETGCTDVATASPGSVSLSVGGSAALSATHFTPTGKPVTGAAFTWISSNSSIARVVTSPSVQVIGVSPGAARIDAMSGEATASVAVQVTAAPQASVVTVVATDAAASETGPDGGTFTVSRTGSTAAALPVGFTLTGTATVGVDYAALNSSVTIAAGQSSTAIQINPLADPLVEGNETVILTIGAGSYSVGTPSAATVTIADGSSAAGTLVNGRSQRCDFDSR
ncbi:MAG: Ig-like domain-containing protein [Gemmatimonadetes bacterium]|nr:Ig-like domain-containing protein [Gemmatimonadota bacterium]